MQTEGIIINLFLYVENQYLYECKHENFILKNSLLIKRKHAILVSDFFLNN